MYNFSVQKISARFSQLYRERPTRTKILYGVLAFFICLGLYKSIPDGAGSALFGFSGADAYIPASVWRYRAERVKQAVQHAYRGYELYAMPKDELRPLTNEGMNYYNGWAVTAFDSLDTLWLLGLKEEYDRALEVVQKVDFQVPINPRGLVPFFETIIRYMGGLLSAYALSKDPILLKRAEDLADALDPIFSTPSGLPAFAVNPLSNWTDGNSTGVLAEIASWQLEYTYLAHASGKKKYLDHVQNLNNILYQANLNASNGMLPVGWDLKTGAPETREVKVSVGAQADSAHEYLLKQYLLTAQTDKINLELYLHTTSHILTNLLYLSPKRQLLYVTDTASSRLQTPLASHTFEHLSCFLPGLLALGAHTLPLDNLRKLGIDISTLGTEARFGNASQLHNKVANFNLKKLHLWAAEGLAQTCWLTYADQPTGLGPDEMLMQSFAPGAYMWNEEANAWTKAPPGDNTYLWIDAMEKWKETGSKGPIPGLSNPKPVLGRESGRDYYIRRANYLLRPETVESFYILWKVTGDVKWRTRGWAVFEALERETKTETGYVTLKNVAWSPPLQGNSMPSFFLAETLKYLYLLFSEEDPLPLDKWVFNTEAHPLPIFQWTDDERVRFNITSY
ncbi:mannosidase [Coprinopsis cinerea okayama7|uniref:alpha-1,2-Mannosidase n=1 Tax=Coprinopsis cinerea (strain Okayama-7 / 130 / ATCC MYA-4618 / FGSC 9003) TaxID=240176 RepID=A8N9H0_COPC7|nr:mannosidase [Coprinopsis cinerea okayama7\|eukprot:XP_001831476.2 mannosidase [Coprinopsis cinerea okayama7\